MILTPLLAARAQFRRPEFVVAGGHTGTDAEENVLGDEVVAFPLAAELAAVPQLLFAKVTEDDIICTPHPRVSGYLLMDIFLGAFCFAAVLTRRL